MNKKHPNFNYIPCFFIYVLYKIFSLSPQTYLKDIPSIYSEEVKEFISTGHYNYSFNNVSFHFKIEPNFSELDENYFHNNTIISEKKWWLNRSFSILVSVNELEIGHIDVHYYKNNNFYEINFAFEDLVDLISPAIQIDQNIVGLYNGIGTTLMTFALAIAKESNADHFNIKDGQLAKNFYIKHFGFIETSPILYVFDFNNQEIPFQNIVIEKKNWLPYKLPENLIIGIKKLNNPIFQSFKIINGIYHVLEVKGDRLPNWIEKVSAPNSTDYINDQAYLKKIIEWMLLIANALNQLNDEGLKHGNLSLSNVVINSISKRPKLVDMTYNSNDLEELPKLLYSCLTKRFIMKSLKGKVDAPNNLFNEVNSYYDTILIKIALKNHSSFQNFINELKNYYERTFKLHEIGPTLKNKNIFVAA